MAHPKATRDKLRGLYINGQSLEAAAQLCKVAFGTARRWRDAAKDGGDDWDKLRAAHALAGGDVEAVARGMIAGQIVQYESVMKELQEAADISPLDKAKALASLSDSFNKAMAANRRLLPEVHEAAVAIKTVDLLSQHIKQYFPQLNNDFLNVFESFIPVIEQEF